MTSEKRLLRSRKALIGGVCAGVAHRLGVDPLLIRAGVIALTFAGGFGLVAYLVAWLLLPDHHGQILLHKNGYWADWMSEYAGQEVLARFNPEDLHEGLYIYSLAGEYLAHQRLIST